MAGHDFTAWFVDYPSTHVKAGRTVEVVPRALLDAVPVRRLWQTCPICSGRCTVPAGFYGVALGTGNVPCRRCAATGTIVQPS